MQPHIDPQCETINPFNSARWKRGYNPDLNFVSESIANMCGTYPSHATPCNPVIMAHPTPFRRRFNLRKAHLNGYSAALNKLIEDVDPIPEKYGGFLENVCVISRMYILRGCRTNYITGLSEESKGMYED